MQLYFHCINNIGNEASFTIGQVYKALPATADERAEGLVRIIDNEGEDYLYSATQFEPFTPSADRAEGVTVYLSPYLKGVLHAEALAAHKPVSALVREWIDERLDLPQGA